MLIEVITIFPEMFEPILSNSILKRAQEKGLVKIKVHNLRDYSSFPRGAVDAPSYGGGGMVFRPEPLFLAAEKILSCSLYPQKNRGKNERIILFSPRGEKLTQKKIKQFLNYERLLLIAPRYEGVDERVRQYLIDEEISLGDYILSGAELAALVFIDCLVRIIPGVVSDRKSIKEESFENCLLDWPHYTRPRNFRGLKVPAVLLSGDHKKIKEWREKTAYGLTKKIRPDLIEDNKQKS